jgi:hypothetical protein
LCIGRIITGQALLENQRRYFMVIDTMKRISIKTFISIGLALAGIMLVTSTAHAQCEAFPKVPWWGTLNHEKITSFVS